MRVVVDASALGALAFGEPEGATVAAHLTGATLLAPTLIDDELASAALKKIRRSPAAATLVMGGLAAALRLPITRVAVPAAQVVPLANATGLTTYDASYLWLALAHDAELVTLDDELGRVNLARRQRP